MLRQSEPTSSTLQLVASDMTDIMEKLDSRELDLGDGEYDTTDANVPGERISSAWSVTTITACICVCYLMCLCICWCFSLQRSVCLSRPSTTRWVSRSPRPKSSCRLRSPPRSWRWSGSPRLRTASTSPRRGASTRCTHLSLTFHSIQSLLVYISGSASIKTFRGFLAQFILDLEDAVLYKKQNSPSVVGA